MLDMPPGVFVFCALACEARPLIKAWRLEKLPESGLPIPIYVDSEKVVVITGIGKINMAGALGFVLALFKHSKSPILINLGIAGHRSLPLGTLCLGHKITDSETDRSFYPQLPFSVPCVTHSVLTIARPHTEYSMDCLYDMEAAGFYEMAVKFSTSERIQVVKIVSDNWQSPIANISEALVEDWIASQVVAIDSLLSQLVHLRQVGQVVESSLYQQLLGQFHFTASNSLKLKAALQRWQLLRSNEPLAWEGDDIRNAKAVLAWIETQLDRTEFYL